MRKKTPESVGPKQEIPQINHEKELFDILNENLPVIKKMLGRCIDFYLNNLELLVHYHHDVNIKDRPILFWLWKNWFFKRNEDPNSFSHWLDRFWEKQLDLRLRKITADTDVVSISTFGLLKQYYKMREFVILAETEVLKYYHEEYSPELIIMKFNDFLSPDFILEQNGKVKAIEHLDNEIYKRRHSVRMDHLGFDAKKQEQKQISRYGQIAYAIGEVMERTAAELIEEEFKTFKKLLSKVKNDDLKGPGWSRKRKGLEIPYEEEFDGDSNLEESPENLKLVVKKLMEEWNIQEINEVNLEVALLEAMEVVNPTPRERELFFHIYRGTRPPNMKPDAYYKASQRLRQKILDSMEDKPKKS